MTTERLTGLISNPKVPVWELDQAFWAHDRGVDYPLTHYDLDHWEGCVREGDPAAQAVSDTGALLRLIEDRYPGHRMDLRAEGGRARISLLITETRDGKLPIGVSGEFQGEAAASQIGRAIALATVRADGLARNLERRLTAIEGLAERVPPYADWPVEEVSRGRWGAVHHGLRLLCATANSPEGAARHATMNHKGDYGLMLCRERYETLAPQAGLAAQRAEPARRAIAAPVLHLFGSRGEYDRAVAGGALSADTPMTGDFDLAPGDPNGTARPAIEALDRISRVIGDRAIIDNELLGTSLVFLVSGDQKPELRIHGTLREFTERKIRELDLERTHVVRRETPADPEADLVWMVGTRDSVLQDAYTAGPDNAPDLLKLGMMEGEILIGKDRRGEVRVVREMGSDGCVDVPGGLEALRSDDSPEP